jgi:hypothetical protein
MSAIFSTGAATIGDGTYASAISAAARGGTEGSRRSEAVGIGRAGIIEGTTFAAGADLTQSITSRYGL